MTKQDKVSEVIFRERCTHMYIPSYLAKDLLERPDLAEKFSSVRSIDMTGERFQKRFIQLKGKICQKFFVWYGSQEATAIASFSSEDPSMYPEAILGETFPGVSVKIEDKSGNIVPRGNRGEICVSSPFLFTEYVGKPDLYAAAFDADGWFHTGDIGHMLPDGKMVIDGRKAEVISVGIDDYFPKEIEEEITKCPGITGVVAVPVPDKRLGNAICACVTVENREEHDVAYLENFMEDFWVQDPINRALSCKPQYIVIYDKFPLGRTGKVNRRALAENAAIKLGLNEDE